MSCCSGELFLVILHVSAPYSKTDFTLKLRIRNKVVVQIFLQAQMLFSMANPAALALPDLDLMTRSVIPCLSTTLPSYLNDLTSLMGNPLTVVYALVLIFISFVFFKLI